MQTNKLDKFGDLEGLLLKIKHVKKIPPPHTHKKKKLVKLWLI